MSFSGGREPSLLQRVRCRTARLSDARQLPNLLLTETSCSPGVEVERTFECRRLVASDQFGIGRNRVQPALSAQMAVPAVANGDVADSAA